MIDEGALSTATFTPDKRPKWLTSLLTKWPSILCTAYFDGLLGAFTNRSTGQITGLYSLVCEVMISGVVYDVDVPFFLKKCDT